MTELAHQATGEAGLTFVIRAESEDVPLGLFVKAVDDVRKLVAEVDYAVTREKRGRLWVVTEIHSSYPTITIRPLLDGAETVSSISQGLAQLNARNTLDPPRHFSAGALEDLKKMRRLFVGRERANGIDFSSNGGPVVTIDERIADRVDRVLRGGYTALGSIDGMLDAVNLHRNPVATVWDRLTGIPVRCYLPGGPTWKQRTKALLEQRVRVTGTIRYFRNGLPQAMFDVSDIEQVTPDPSSPRGDFGTVPGIIGGQDSVQYVKSRR